MKIEAVARPQGGTQEAAVLKFEKVVQVDASGKKTGETMELKSATIEIKSGGKGEEAAAA